MFRPERIFSDTFRIFIRASLVPRHKKSVPTSVRTQKVGVLPQCTKSILVGEIHPLHLPAKGRFPLIMLRQEGG